MRRLIALIFTIASSSVISSAQTVAEMEYIMRFHGETDPEEMDSYEVERLSELLTRPVMINLSTASRLTSSGLFTRYQVASLIDYRMRHGDVLSYSELEALDGFGGDFVERVAPFISLYSPRLPGERADTLLSVSCDVAVRSGFKFDVDESPKWNYAVKGRTEAGERIYASIASSRSASAEGSSPDSWSGALAWSFKKLPARIMIGDYNARFGQGLALWNGMTMSGLSTPSAFIKSASGLSRSWSFTGNTSFTGIASDIIMKHVSVSAMVAFPGIKDPDAFPYDVTLLPALNMVWHGSNGQIGLTHYAEFTGLQGPENLRIPDMKTASDVSYCFDGVDVSSEIVYDWVNSSIAGIGAVRFPVGENVRLASMLRFYPPLYDPGKGGAARAGSKCTNEYGAAVSGQFSAGEWISIRCAQGFGSSVRRHSGTFSIDAAYFPVPKDNSDRSIQIKALALWEMMLTDALRIKVRLSERIRSWGHPFRTDFRLDLMWQSSILEFTARVNALKCMGLGLVSYAEGGYRGDRLSFFLRAGIYAVDNWDDRIYVYERDAPGSFNVPALYGRGIWASATASWRFSRWGRVYFRASKKPGKAELKIQGVFSF